MTIGSISSKGHKRENINTRDKMISNSKNLPRVSDNNSLTKL